MLMKDLMITDATSVACDTSVTEAERVMKDSNLYHLPVVDNGKVVGMITRDVAKNKMLHAPKTMGKSEFMSMLAKMKTKDVMVRNIASVHSETRVEEAMSLAQNYGIQGFAVMEDGKLVGTAMKTDFLKFYIKEFGFVEKAKRPTLFICCEMRLLPEVLEIVSKRGGEMLSLCHLTPPSSDGTCTIHLNVEDAEEIMNTLNCLKSHTHRKVPELAVV